jgi:hypothetical protein
MSSSPDDLAESRLLAQLTEIDVQMLQLAAEKSALERLIRKIREGKCCASEVTRQNSIDRIVIEQRIKEILIQYNYPVDGKYVYKELTKIMPDLKPATYRSHLHRMKERGMVARSKKRGFLTLPATTGTLTE